MPDLMVVQGETYVFDVHAVRDEVPVDLTGAKVWFTMKKNRRDVDASALVQHDSSDSSQQVRIINAVSGVIRVKLVPTDTVNLAPSYYPYDVQVKEADGTVTKLERGFVELSRTSTKTLV